MAALVAFWGVDAEESYPSLVLTDLVVDSVAVDDPEQLNRLRRWRAWCGWCGRAGPEAEEGHSYGCGPPSM